MFRNDPARELLKRPVQRGQLLLEVVPKHTVWELDLRIPSHLAPYVREHIASGVESPTIRYAMRAAPDQSWKTALSSVDNAFQVVDGQIVCMANAELKSLPTTEMRPGQSVVARIHCGRRSLGFVWFREVIEFWHQLRFAWF